MKQFSVVLSMWAAWCLTAAAGPPPGASAAIAAFDAKAFWREPERLAFDEAVLDRGAGDGIRWRSIVYTSEVYRGEPMRIFAWYARPAGQGKVPGVLSIHGGGGGADLGRAKAFARAGYACLSYDWNTFGDKPAKRQPGKSPAAEGRTVYGSLRYTDWAGQFVAGAGDWKQPVLYRAIMAARRGLTWLGRQDEVDADRLVVEGHSWGGFLTQLLVGIEPRIKAAVSSAAAGAWVGRYVHGQEGHLKQLSPWSMFQWSRRYDPATFADHVAAPILIRLATADFFGSVDTLADYWPAITAPKSLQLQASSNHGFADVATRVAWFDRWVGKGEAFPEITTFALDPQPAGRWAVRMTARGPRPIVKASVAWTTGAGPWNRRAWLQRPLAKTPAGWAGQLTPVAAGGKLRAFVSAMDAAGRIVSSMPAVRALPAAKAPPRAVAAAEVVVARSRAGKPDWAEAKRIGPIAPGPEAVGEMSAELETLWDADALHLRLSVADPTPWQPAAPGGAFWRGDSVQLRMATGAAEANVLHLGFYGDAKTGKLTVEAVRGAKFDGRVKDVSPVTATAAVREGAGYTVTARVPWSFIGPGFGPEAGATFRLALMVNCGDVLLDERAWAVDFNGASAFGKPASWGAARLE